MVKKAKSFVPVVAVLNMKGGVGKTTICSNVSLSVFENKEVGTLLIDLDPQFNLTQGLLKRADYDKYKAASKTIFSAMEPRSEVGLFDVATSTQPPPKSEDLRHSFFYLTDMPSKEFDIIPGDFQLVKYSLMDDNAKLKGVKDRFLKFLRQCKSSYDTIFIDCNPSSSFLTLCALHAATHILVPVRPDRFSILGLEILSEFIDQLPTLSPKPQLLILLNGVSRGGRDAVAASVEAELRAHPRFGPRTLKALMPQSEAFRARTDYTGFAIDRKGRWQKQIGAELTAIANELAGKLGL
ncbi:chromosome partitioning protein [Bradyrhizobium huanghuaihaiense]|uniref:Chromosome partitioning protein n=1 Tax=Bradyrhizobium huanghuaihaiense TaxID=990078 RepID=A0A562RGB2_9BRAD|nr:ParA family protein [Bradyrhizobium huanghuaihaiense]TWI68085.1 chromosome partitioning protein [Bradyrhizobium huanghuaihaiense]